LNCGSLKAPFIDVEIIVYCLLVETGSDPVLIDTGFGDTEIKGKDSIPQQSNPTSFS